MKIEYDQTGDLLYLYFRSPGKKVSKTVTVVPGIHADLAVDDSIIGVEVFDASEFVGEGVNLESVTDERNRQLEQRIRELTSLNQMFQEQQKQHSQIVETFKSFLDELETNPQDVSDIIRRARSQLVRG